VEREEQEVVNIFEDLRREIFRLRAVVRSQIDGLNHWRKVYDRTQFEGRVRSWIIDRFGPENIQERERLRRFFEESVEFVQAAGMPQDEAQRLLQHVYERPAGEKCMEAGGVVITLAGWCAATGNTIEDLGNREFERISHLTVEQVHQSLARKRAAGV